MPGYVGYGGTFDPVHLGHVAVAKAVHDVLAAPVFLVPAADPPHKPATGAHAAHRRRMLELAIAGEPGLHVDARELERIGPSYTVDTLAAIRDELGAGASIAWVVGADSLVQLHRWHRWRELFDLAHVIAVGRPGHVLDPTAAGSEARDFLRDRVASPATLREAPAGRLALLPMEPPRMESSTQIRALAAKGQPWSHLVPAAVASYIGRHRLYATGDSA